MSKKGNWSYFDNLEVITTQKCSNRFENDVEKWHLLAILTIIFDPQRIFEWDLFLWKVDILDLYWVSFGHLKLGHLSSQNYGFWEHLRTLAHTCECRVFSRSSELHFLGPKASLFDGAPPLDPLEHPKLSKWAWKP